MNILLVGHPNVGKSVVFSQLTGVRVISSNYPGTTVGFAEGTLHLADGAAARLIDVPGAYSISNPASKAEEIAARMFQEGDLIVNVLDATRLERNLQLTLELLESGKPMIVVLNMWDEARHKGLTIDFEKLERILGVPVVPTVAVTAEGIKNLNDSLSRAAAPKPPVRTDQERWMEIGRIVGNVQTETHRHHTFLEWLADCSVNAWTGVPIAVLLLALSFVVVRLIGEGITTRISEPFFEIAVRPVVETVSSALGGRGFAHHLLVGSLVGGRVDFEQSFGMLTTALFVEFAIVLPYVLAFYLWLGILEDFGYLPRLAVLLDRIMHRMGLHGWGIIPTLLGLGCNVPAILATRVLEDRRERLIASTLVSITVPCAALQAMIWALVGDPKRGGGPGHVAIVYGTLFFFWLVIGRVLAAVLPGSSPELLMEIPPYRRPHLPTVAKNLWLRTWSFLREATPVLLMGVLVVNVLTWFHAFKTLAHVCSPVVSGLLGLPEEASVALAVGFLRKDMAMGLLGAMDMGINQMVVASTVLAMFFPCIATFTVLAKELGLRDMLKSVGIMIVASLTAGTALNLLL